MVHVRVYHNINRDAGFGLNAVFTKQGKTFAQTPEERHELVLVFEYDAGPASDRVSYSHQRLLVDAFDTFNVGSDELAAQYRARKLRSLSVGDVVEINDSAYACESVGWELCSSDDLRIIPADEAERLVRERFDFGPHEALAITVPLREG
jgi:hypothetical protein